MKNIQILMLAFLLPLGLGAQQPVSYQHITDGVYRLLLNERVTATAFIGTDGVLLIDAGYDNTAKATKDLLHSLDKRDISFLINTHLHGDHTGGNVILGEGATVVSHENVKKWLTSERRQGDKAPGPMAAAGIPRITFTENMDLTFNGQTLQMKHMPVSHTNSDIIIYIPESDVVVVGDLLFADNFPYIDTSQGGSVAGFMKSLQWLAENFTEDTRFIGGHGPVYTRGQLRNYADILKKQIGVVADALSRGLTTEQMKQQRILKTWESYGKFFITEERWIDTVVNSGICK